MLSLTMRILVLAYILDIFIPIQEWLKFLKNFHHEITLMRKWLFDFTSSSSIKMEFFPQAPWYDFYY